jgi:electron transfer flavoprotein alpha subunit
MKAAIILSLNSDSIEHQAGEINVMLKEIAPVLTRVELWLFFLESLPECIPEIGCPVAAVKLIEVENEFLPESYLKLLMDVTDQTPVDLMIFSSDGLGRELATRMACRLSGSSCLQVLECHPISGRFEVLKPVFGNNVKAKFVLRHLPFCLSMAKIPCIRAKQISLDLYDTQILSLQQTPCHWVTELVTIQGDSSKNGLADADQVLVVGQGIKSKENLERLQDVATAIGFEFGASRPVVMNAWTHTRRLVGISGQILSPKLCIVAGVSGTAVFSAGINASEFIVAINTDKTAPIFNIAHVGIIEDMLCVLIELEKVISAEKEKNVSKD